MAQGSANNLQEKDEDDLRKSERERERQRNQMVRDEC